MKTFCRAYLAHLPLTFFALLATSSLSFAGRPVEVHDEIGQARLARAASNADFVALANQWEAQNNPVFSGPASAAMVLNALRARSLHHLRRPSSMGNPPSGATTLPEGVDPFYRRYTQKTVFTQRSEQIKTLAEAMGATHTAHVGARPEYGLKLRQLAGILRNHGVSVRLRIANDRLDDSEIRSELISNLSSAGDYVIVNYDRKKLGQRDHSRGRGNTSPLGAYDSRSDSFLILDVNPYASPWVWVKSSDLVAAMRTRDQGENRGYVLVSEKK